MAVFPLADIMGDKEVRRGGQYHQQDQKEVQAGEQQQIYGETTEVCQQLSQRPPDMLCRVIIAAGGPLCLILQLQNFWVVDVGIGRFAAFSGDHAHDGTANIDLCGHPNGVAIRCGPL